MTVIDFHIFSTFSQEFACYITYLLALYLFRNPYKPQAYDRDNVEIQLPWELTVCQVRNRLLPSLQTVLKVSGEKNESNFHREKTAKILQNL